MGKRRIQESGTERQGIEGPSLGPSAGAVAREPAIQKSHYTVGEAVQYLNRETSDQLSARDLYEMAGRGQFKFLHWFAGEIMVARDAGDEHGSCLVPANTPSRSQPTVGSTSFRGYYEIPVEHLGPDGVRWDDVDYFRSVTLYDCPKGVGEAVEASAPLQQPNFYVEARWRHGECELRPLRPRTEDLLIRRTELAGLLAASAEEKHADLDRDVAWKERTTLLLIIHALAKELGFDVREPYKAAAAILTLTDKFGHLSENAIANHLKKIPEALQRHERVADSPSRSTDLLAPK